MARCRTPCILPRVFLINLYAHQGGHDFRQTLVVVAFHPHHFDVAFGIGELADQAEKLPLLFAEPAKIQIGENVAQENEPPETAVPSGQPGGFTSAAAFRPQVQVREDQRVMKTADP